MSRGSLQHATILAHWLRVFPSPQAPLSYPLYALERSSDIHTMLLTLITDGSTKFFVRYFVKPVSLQRWKGASSDFALWRHDPNSSVVFRRVANARHVHDNAGYSWSTARRWFLLALLLLASTEDHEYRCSKSAPFSSTCSSSGSRKLAFMPTRGLSKVEAKASRACFTVMIPLLTDS